MKRRFTKEVSVSLDCRGRTNKQKLQNNNKYTTDNRKFFSHCSEKKFFLTLFSNQKFEIKGASRAEVWWGLSPWVAVNYHLTACSHDLPSVPACAERNKERERERERDDKRECLSVFSYKDSNLTLTAFHFYDFI